MCPTRCLYRLTSLCWLSVLQESVITKNHVRQLIVVSLRFCRSEVEDGLAGLSAPSFTRPKSSCQLAGLSSGASVENLLPDAFRLLTESSPWRFETGISEYLLAGGWSRSLPQQPLHSLAYGHPSSVIKDSISPLVPSATSLWCLTFHPPDTVLCFWGPHEPSHLDPAI